MAKWKIELDRKNCIGAGSCEMANPALWKMGDDNKVNLQGATLNEQTGMYELIIDEADLPVNQDAAAACPVNVIKITKVEE